MTKNKFFITRSLLIGALSIGYLGTNQAYGLFGISLSSLKNDISDLGSYMSDFWEGSETVVSYGKQGLFGGGAVAAIKDWLPSHVLYAAAASPVFKKLPLLTEIKQDVSHFRGVLTTKMEDIKPEEVGKVVLAGVGGKLVVAAYLKAETRLPELVDRLKAKADDKESVDKDLSQIYIKGSYKGADIDAARRWAEGNGLSFDEKTRIVEGKLDKAFEDISKDPKDAAKEIHVKLIGIETRMHNRVLDFDADEKFKVVDFHEFNSALKTEIEKHEDEFKGEIEKARTKAKEDFSHRH